MSNPALSLSPEMIIGLLDALSSQKEENIFVKDFLDLLNAHPVVRASRDRSLAPSPLSLVSPAPVPALPATIEVSSAVDSSEKTSSVSTSATNVVQSAVLEDINQSNTDIEDGGGRGGEEGKGTGTCCRNGVKKVNLKPKKGAVKRGAGGGGDLGRKAKRLKDVILESEEEEEKEDGDNEQKEGKGRRGRKRWEAPAWLQDGTPPPTDSRTTDLINHLARLDLNQDLQTLIMLCRRLIQPDLSISDVDIPPTSLAAAIADCVKRESNVVCESFYEMISLIRLAFYIEKEMRMDNAPTLMEIAKRKDVDVTYKTLWNWFAKGTRLIHLCSGGTFYMLLALASLDLGGIFLSRSSKMSYVIEALAFALRTPERANISESDLFKLTKIIIPQITRIRNCGPIRSALSFVIFPPSDGSCGLSLDFFDVKATDHITDDFRTNVFILPERSGSWASVLDSTSVPMPIECLYPPQSVIPEYLKASVIHLPFSLASEPDSPLTVNKRHTWTETERKKAMKAPVASSLHDLGNLLDKSQKEGKRKPGAYVKIPQKIIKGKNLHFRDCSDALVALLISNGSDFIRPRLQRLQNLLEGVNPDFVNSCNSNQKGFKFMSIYADTYNRFAEKGEGAPRDIHPYFLYKEGTTHTNHEQRRPYLASAIKNNPQLFDNIDVLLQDIVQFVCAALEEDLKDSFNTLRIFCEILPLNHQPATYPFPGYVLNINVCTEGHLDTGDVDICIVMPIGSFKGGELALHEAGLVLEMVEGDILIFPSWRITHFNLHFEGVRLSLVLHSDKDVKTWVSNRNSWDGHMVV